MGQKRKPRFKQCRRFGVNLYGNPKALDRKVSEQRRGKPSEYSQQLNEKQKVKAYYNIREKQMRRYYEDAFKREGTTSLHLFRSLESRLDNLVLRMHFASTIFQARQMVGHGHILVNGRRVDIPSYQVRPGDTISLKQASRSNEMFKTNFQDNAGAAVPYVCVDENQFSGIYERLPERGEIPIDVEDQLVIEFYSR
ncbi:30S ribosomal protein S4 [Pseudoramibacter faecis]|uniref:30S ribosomal protein S4 n=1 Tax=Pseudoramibacter faecis TaxID=3108534 RepID=UPI002E76CE7F|nr:30S ribosomal protein S4 [Pseudoramibacter sp. HA2172]